MIKAALLAAAVTALVVAGASASRLASHAGNARGLLEARAILPANVTAPGPPSGAALGPGPINGLEPPFPRQPVQGFSGVLKDGSNRWLGLPDNGYGRKENSADWLQRVYRIRTQFKRAGGGRGRASVLGYVDLKDPDRRFRFPLVRRDRRFTGADIDPESIMRGARGTFWVGDEFGPWMLHFSRTGRLLKPPVPLPASDPPRTRPLHKRASSQLSGAARGSRPSPPRRTASTPTSSSRARCSPTRTSVAGTSTTSTSSTGGSRAVAGLIAPRIPTGSSPMPSSSADAVCS